MVNISSVKSTECQQTVDCLFNLGLLEGFKLMCDSIAYVREVHNNYSTTNYSTSRVHFITIANEGEHDLDQWGIVG